MKNILFSTIVLFMTLFGLKVYAQPGYTNKIPIPPIISAENGLIELDMRVLPHKFDPNGSLDSLNGTSQTGIPAMCYNKAGETSMTYLGPTLFWRTGDSVNIKINNYLGEPTTTHWHGAELPAQFDGGPHQPIADSSSWSIHIVDLDSSSTIWYHPHYHNTTFEQVQSGLSGMIISEQSVDPIRDVVPHTYGVDDIPIVIGDQKTKNNNGNYQIDLSQQKRPISLVNGVTNPFYEVPAHFVRLRILNGSTRKGILVGLADNDTDTSMAIMQPFVVMASDGGYSLKPDTMNNLMMGPGERYEILLDLRGYNEGDSVFLRNLKQYIPNSIVGSPFSGPYGQNPNVYGKGDSTAGNAFLKLKIVNDAVAQDTVTNWSPVDTIPSFTANWSPEAQDTTGIANYRLKALTRDNGLFHINHTTFDMMTIDDIVCVNTKEVWKIKNETEVAHPFHIHKIFFRVLTVQDEGGNYLSIDSLGWNGPKDDILVRAGWTVRFMGVFNDFPNPIQANLSYMYHCHILTHEDAIGGGMMKQFVVTDEYPCHTGLEEEDLSSMLLFPNPARDQLFIRGYADSESNIDIVDVRGNIVVQQQLDPFDGEMPIGIEKLSPGFYVVRWTINESTYTQKLIIE